MSFFPIQDLDQMKIMSDNVLESEIRNTPSLDKYSSIEPSERTFPGTNWCGLGNISGDNNSLGMFRDVDKCCRSHDFCPDFITAFQTKHNLTNHMFYTRLHCQCDQEFRNCLKSIDSSLANSIGVIYFTFLGTRCFNNEFPVKSCKKHSHYLWRKICVDYEFDLKDNKRYQWFDLPFYY